MMSFWIEKIVIWWLFNEAIKARGQKPDKKETENQDPNLKLFETILLVEVVCQSKIKMIFRHNRLILLMVKIAFEKSKFDNFK